MRDMPFQFAVALASLQFTSVETVCNVAVVGAILSSAVFADEKSISTVIANDLEGQT